MAIAIGLYLYDSALLLYGNEGVVTTQGGSGWRVAFGSAIELRGKALFVPAPLFPHRPVFRLAWNFAGAGGGDPGWTARRALLAPLAPAIWVMAAALFVLLPLGLFTRLGESMLLAALALLYGGVIGALAWLAFRRARLDLAPRRLAQLAFEALLCPPFALNLVRKLSAEFSVEEDLVGAARRLLRAPDWEAARGAFLARLDEELEQEEGNEARLAALKRCRQRLLEDAGGAP